MGEFGEFWTRQDKYYYNNSINQYTMERSAIYQHSHQLAELISNEAFIKEILNVTAHIYCKLTEVVYLRHYLKSNIIDIIKIFTISKFSYQLSKTHLT